MIFSFAKLCPGLDWAASVQHQDPEQVPTCRVRYITGCAHPEFPPPCLPIPAANRTASENKVPTRKLSGRKLCGSPCGQKRSGLAAALAFVPGSFSWLGERLSHLGTPRVLGDSVGKGSEGQQHYAICVRELCSRPQKKRVGRGGWGRNLLHAFQILLRPQGHKVISSRWRARGGGGASQTSTAGGRALQPQTRVRAPPWGTIRKAPASPGFCFPFGK